MTLLEAEDAVIVAILLVWMTLDRCNVYFRKPRD